MFVLRWKNVCPLTGFSSEPFVYFIPLTSAMKRKSERIRECVVANVGSDACMYFGIHRHSGWKLIIKVHARARDANNNKKWRRYEQVSQSVTESSRQQICVRHSFGTKGVAGSDFLFVNYSTWRGEWYFCHVGFWRLLRLWASLSWIERTSQNTNNANPYKNIDI